jgi:hypothetical protein
MNLPPALLLAAWPVTFATPLSAAQWAVLVGIPVGIIALYFLKLRRRPVQVSSTLLWRRSLEDLHVNSLFQRLRRNLLLFLQLLAVLLAMLALAGPRIKGTTGQGQRYILVVDNSASMSATDVAPSRLERARAEAQKIVDGMESDDSAMIITFSDRARVVSNYTSNRALLRQRLRAIEPTEGSTSLREALVVASGLANPSSDLAARAMEQGTVAVRTALPPKLMIYTDGGFPDVTGFSVGNLEPHVVVVGPAPPPRAPEPPTKAPEVKTRDASDNVAVLALQTARNDERPDQFQVFGRVHNYRAQPVEAEAKLLRHDPAKPRGAGTLIDAVALTIDPQSDQAFKFDLPDTGLSTELEVRIDVKDALPLDNRAFTVFGKPRKAQILLATPGNRYLSDTLRTTTAAEIADIAEASPDELKEDELKRELAAGRYDFVIFDRVRPEAPPEANTLYFGALPPGPAFEKPRAIEGPVLLDWNIAHPLMQYVRDLSLVRVAKAATVELPSGSTTLIESNQGPVAFTLPRGGFVDAVVTFALLDGKNFNSDWPVRYSFPLFIYNATRVLGNVRDSAGDEIHQPGQPVIVRADSQTQSIEVVSPDGTRRTIDRNTQGTFVDNQADHVGLYHARWDKDGAQSYAVNLFDSRESDLAPRGMVPEGTPLDKEDEYTIKIGYTAVKGTRRSTPAVKDWWKPISIAVLGILLLEWYIYNRRVYI